MNHHFPQTDPAVIRTAKRGSTEGERARTEVLLARYPELDESEIEELRRWFCHRATSADVALLACNEQLYPRYAAFRRVHVDALAWWQKAIVAALAVLPLALVGASLAENV